MMHPIQCQCGTVKGEISGSGPHSRVICYCKDCRAFARFLGDEQRTLDAQGGTEVLQLAQARIRWLAGEDQLAAMRLSPKGLVRWYCRCCRTPIGNTMAERNMCFIGLIHNCLQQDRLDADFGAAVAQANTEGALGSPKPQKRGIAGVILRFLFLVLRGRLSGSYRRSPFYHADGTLKVTPQVISAAERTALTAPDHR